MSERVQDLPLLGYVDKLSARPGETLEFKVSSLSDTPFSTRLVRSIGADPNPDGPGIIEEDVSDFFQPQRFASVHRPFFAGSYGLAQSEVSFSPKTSVVFAATIFPTLRSNRPQTVLSVGEYDLQINTDGAACLIVGGQSVATAKPLNLRNWYRIQGKIEGGEIFIKQQLLSRNEVAPISGRGQCAIAVTQIGKPAIAARFGNGKATQFFNGKIESPSITVDGQPLCMWDFSSDIPTSIVPASAGPSLNLINFPARAVTSSNWDGSEMNWNHKPEHYRAIHFHEDDIYDFEWGTDFSFTIPGDMPPGIYIMHLECEDYRDAIPFFVCSPKGKRKADLCVLVSTFTYSVYGNHARPNYDKAWQEQISAWNAYPYNAAEHTQYGLSTYNYHSDGSGICHASHRRPLFNVRPGYLTFGATPCSGLRHFPADSHLISWLHSKNIEYDVITDDELHKEGVAAIEGYKAVTTGTHPEYHTEESLNALRDYRDGGGHLLYLGGNGFYWRIARHCENDSMLEIRRAEAGIRAWAAEPGEYYNAFDGTYGGLWRRNGRAPQDLVGVGFAAQGEFFGDPYRRVCTDPAYDWVFEGINELVIGDFGFSGNGAAGFELDHMDRHIGTPENAILLARSVTRKDGFMLVPEEQLTHLTNLAGGTEAEAKHADMIYVEYPNGGTVFATGSITFCGSLPWNNFDNNVSRLLHNILVKHLS